MPEGIFRITFIMKNIRKVLPVLLAAALMMPLVSCAGNSGSQADKQDDGKFNIVTSFYPMHVLTLNVAGGIEGVSVECMSDPNLGCIHDHVFSTEDLRLIENADVYVENGLDLETFNDQILNAYPNLTIIEAASDVTDAPADEDEVNGHVWTNLDDYILEIREVADGLSEADPDHADQYSANADAYIARIEQLKSDYAEQIASVNGLTVLVIDETLPSFCDFLGSSYEVVETDHEQSALSAGDVADMVDWMNDNNVTYIFISADTDSGIADAIAVETGAQEIMFNTCMTGTVDADAYITQMEENLALLGTLG